VKTKHDFALGDKVFDRDNRKLEIVALGKDFALCVPPAGGAGVWHNTNELKGDTDAGRGSD